MQQPLNYAEERWRSVENKLDRLVESFNAYAVQAAAQYAGINGRVTNLENKPQEQAQQQQAQNQRQQQNQQTVFQALGCSMQGFMLMSAVCANIVGFIAVAISLWSLAHH